MARQRALAILFLFLVAAYPALMQNAKRTQRQSKAPVRPAPAKKVDQSPSAVERAIAQRWLQRMPMRERIAQLVIITSYGEAPSSRSAAFRDYVRAIRDLKVGGMIVVNRVVGGTVRNAEPYAMAAFLNRMQRLAKVPLMVGGDFERGASMRVSGTPKYPHLMAYGAAHDLGLTRTLGLSTAREARALGIHWVFAPVADVNNNPDNPIINIRSFGENPSEVGAQVRAFIEGARSDPASRVLLTVKHFPGHGDTVTDSHMALANLTADRDRMKAVELAPFREAIAAEVDAVMTAHMAVPAYEPEPIPATVSNKVLTGLLRKEMNFGGLVVTDAMDMQGLTKEFPGGEAAVRALEAGADVLLMPPNPEGAIKAVMAAVKSGRLTEKRITESALRVLSAKARVGLHKRKLVDLEQISEVIESVESEEHAQLAANRAVALIRNDNGLLPVRNAATACVWALAESRYGQQGRRFEEEVRTVAPEAKIQHFDQQVSVVEMDQMLQKAGTCGMHVVAAYVTVAAYRGNVALGGNYPVFLEKLQSSGTPVAMVAMGSPYVLRSFPWVNSSLATFSTTPPSEVAAARAVFGPLQATGKLPVTIPGIAKLGDGISAERAQSIEE